MQKKIKKFAVSLLVLLFIFAPLRFEGIFNSFTRADVATDQYGYQYLDHSETWGAGDHVIKRGLTIKNGATLTLEKGARILFDNSEGGYYSPSAHLRVEDGNIVANGTQDENIVFEPATSNDYFSIVFVSPPEVKASFFRYVKISKGGSPIYLMQNDHKSFISQAVASSWSSALSFYSGKLHIENSLFNDSFGYAVGGNQTIDNANAGDYFEIANSNFENNGEGAVAVGLSCNIAVNTDDDEDGDIGDEENMDEDDDSGDVPVNPCEKNKVLLRNNWYNSELGPKQGPDSVYGGERIVGDYAFSGIKSCPSFDGCEQPASNVLFLPGVEGSRLYDDSEKLWEPMNNGDVEDLYLDSDGNSRRSDVHAREGDVIGETPVGSNIYESFIDKMNGMKSAGEINDWKPVAYDWRLSLDDILEDGSVENTLRTLAGNSKSGKVTIVAHSNGGLLTKALMKKLGNDEAKNLVDKIIFVAVPQVGTPLAIPAMLHGYKQNFIPVLDTKTARGLAENMKSAYNLLPSDQYFSTVGDPVITFNAGTSTDWIGRYASEVDSKDRLHDFLSDDFRRVEATNANVDIPAKLNENLLNSAENLHNGNDGLDAWTAPEGVKVIQIAGWGVPKTVSSTAYDVENRKYCDDLMCYAGQETLDFDVKSTIDGDGTVVTPSALWLEGTAERYWVDIDSYNIFLIRNADHANILEMPTLINFIEDNVKNSVKNLSSYKYFSTEAPFSNKNRLQYSLHSPLTLDLYAEVDGKMLHTGKNSNGAIEEQIPGTYYQQFGDVKYIYSDESFAGHIEMKGYKKGYFKFEVEELQGDDSKGTITFKDVPSDEHTIVTFDVPSNLASAGDLKIDKDGDEKTDITIESKMDEIVTYDETPPATSVSLDGTRGTNDWYTSDVIMNLSAQDSGTDSVGVLKTEYMLDSDPVWKEYADPVAFSKEGETNVSYRSVDKNGNTEEPKHVTIKIDKTAPEAKLTFDSSAQKLKAIGTDNLGGDVFVTTQEQTITENSSQPQKKGLIGLLFGLLQKVVQKKTLVTATLTDQAGHETQLAWKTTKDNGHLVDADLLSVSYDGNRADIASSGLQYKWVLNWRKNNYLLFASRLKTENSSIESHYFPGKNETWLMERPADLADDNNDDNAQWRPVWKKLPGMVIPAIITNEGNVEIIY